METPAAQLEAGEFIVTKVVELAKLTTELESKTFFFHKFTDVLLTHGYSSDYDRKVWMSIFILHIEFIHFLKGFTVDARLSCFASGYNLAHNLNFA